MNKITKLDIFFSKVFNRMRNKTQLYNGEADDHYHTRLQHTIEVEEIAIMIRDKLSQRGYDYSKDMISQIALLHDIGHTPFGHAGERALHEILSGKEKGYDLPPIEEKGLQIGFKHNHNSGLLYQELVGFNYTNFDVLDGIVKHTKLYQGDDVNLDYGFEYVFVGRNDYMNNNPKTVEGLIVAFADEIAQVCSDYLDMSISCDKDKKVFRMDCKPYNLVKYYSSIHSELASNVARYLSNCFCRDFLKYECYNKDFKKIEEGNFYKIIKNFDSKRREIIDNNQEISKYDNDKKNVIKTLFSYYYHNPSEMTDDFFSDFLYRLKRIKYQTSYVVGSVEFLVGTRDEVIPFIEETIDTVINDKGTESNNRYRDYIKVYKMYLRSIAIYISKMTDSYANHKYDKIVDKFK